jgi:hypothetical protein
MENLNNIDNMNTKFRVLYDTRPDEVVDDISEILKQFGLTITITSEDDDEHIDYEIIKTE